MEVVWTSIMGIKNHDRKMMGKTSIWMFPIYGLGAVIKPLSRKIRKFNMIFRGFIYMAGIYFVEFISGRYYNERTAAHGIIANVNIT